MNEMKSLAVLCERSPQCYIYPSEMVLFSVKGVGVLGALDDGPGGHQLHARLACEEHNLEVILVRNTTCRKEHNLEVILIRNTTWRYVWERTQLGGISCEWSSGVHFFKIIRNTTWSCLLFETQFLVYFF